MPRSAQAPPAKREAPLAPRPRQIENWWKTITYNRDPSFKNLAILLHLIKKFLIVGSPSVTKIIISHAIYIDLCSQLWADQLTYNYVNRCTQIWGWYYYFCFFLYFFQTVNIIKKTFLSKLQRNNYSKKFIQLFNY